jgi:hypothetical protein
MMFGEEEPGYFDTESPGHLAFIGEWEYLLFCGSVCRSPRNEFPEEDGYRKTKHVFCVESEWPKWKEKLESWQNPKNKPAQNIEQFIGLMNKKDAKRLVTLFNKRIRVFGSVNDEKALKDALWLMCIEYDYDVEMLKRFAHDAP